MAYTWTATGNAKLLSQVWAKSSSFQCSSPAMFLQANAFTTGHLTEKCWEIGKAHKNALTSQVVWTWMKWCFSIHFNLGLPFMDRFWNGQPGFDVVLHATWLYSIHGRDVEKSQVNIYQMPLWFVCLFGTSRCSQFLVGDVPLGMLRLSILQHDVVRTSRLGTLL